MKRCYLIRHCLPDFPGGQRYCLGRTDFPLGAEGLAQAEEVASALPSVARVYSSPLRRAVQTAQAIGTPRLVDDLQELYAGDWDGLPFSEIKIRFPELYATRGINPALPLPNGESDQAGLHRFQRAIVQCARESPGDFALVSHGGILRLFLSTLRPGFPKPGYGQIIPLSWNGSTFQLQED